MTTAKVALSMPAEVLRMAKKEVAAGRAKSLSSFVAEAVDASVVLVARRERAVVVSSDVDDLHQLDAELPVERV